VNGRYSHTEYNASFVGFMPSRNPVVAIVVVIDAPHGPNGYFGGTVAAPIFKRIAESAVQYLGIPQSIDPPAPVLVARADPEAQLPAATGADPVVNLIAESSGTIPDLRGMSAREAIHQLARLGLTAHVSGDGIVVSQDPVPGTPIEEGSTCGLLLARTAQRQPEA